MASRPTTLARSLRRAQKRRDYIRVVRRIRKADRINGYVVGVGRRWVLLAVSSDGSPNGFVALRLCDIKRIDWASGGRFMRRSLTAQASWPPPRADRALDLDHGLKRLAESVAGVSSLVTIHPELEHTDICYIGRPVRWGRRKLRLHEVDPQGRWGKKAHEHYITTITRVDFDGVYERNLATVAGQQPSR